MFSKSPAKDEAKHGGSKACVLARILTNIIILPICYHYTICQWFVNQVPIPMEATSSL